MKIKGKSLKVVNKLKYLKKFYIMNVICQSKNCNKKWTNILLLELKSTTFNLFLCENHANNLEYKLLPKWLKICEELRKNNKSKKEKIIMKTWIKNKFK